MAIYYTSNSTLSSFRILFEHLVYSIHSDLETLLPGRAGYVRNRCATSAAAFLRGTLCIEQIATLRVTCIHQAFVIETKKSSVVGKRRQSDVVATRIPGLIRRDREKCWIVKQVIRTISTMYITSVSRNNCSV